MKAKIQLTGIIVGVVALIAFGIWYEASLWQECLKDHSFFYCARVLR